MAALKQAEPGNYLEYRTQMWRAPALVRVQILKQ
jgi:hypothetical protein